MSTGTTVWLRAQLIRSAKPLGVDREAKMIRGMVMAQEGPFKSEGRGEFDAAAIRDIVRLAREKPAGLKSHFAHPTLSDDGLGKLLGRVKNVRTDTLERDGNKLTIARGDLHFLDSAFETPFGNLAGYVMDLTEEDSDGLSSSLVLQIVEEYRIDKKGRPKVDDDGEPLPPLWRPIALHGSDIVDSGDAVDGLLGAQLDFGGLPDGVVRQGAALLDKQFAGRSRDEIRRHCLAWLGRYLSLRFGDDDPAPKPPEQPRRPTGAEMRAIRESRSKRQ